MQKRRNKSGASIRGQQHISENAWNEESGANKSLPILGKLVPMGAANTLQVIESGQTIAFFNNDTAVHFVSFGAQNPPVAAPTGCASGIPLVPKQFTVLASGEDMAFISDSALVFAYAVLDDSLTK